MRGSFGEPLRQFDEMMGKSSPKNGVPLAKKRLADENIFPSPKRPDTQGAATRIDLDNDLSESETESYSPSGTAISRATLGSNDPSPIKLSMRGDSTPSPTGRQSRRNGSPTSPFVPPQSTPSHQSDEEDDGIVRLTPNSARNPRTQNIAASVSFQNPDSLPDVPAIPRAQPADENEFITWLYVPDLQKWETRGQNVTHEELMRSSAPPNAGHPTATPSARSRGGGRPPASKWLWEEDKILVYSVWKCGGYGDRAFKKAYLILKGRHMANGDPASVPLYLGASEKMALKMIKSRWDEIVALMASEVPGEDVFAYDETVTAKRWLRNIVDAAAAVKFRVREWPSVRHVVRTAEEEVLDDTRSQRTAAEHAERAAAGERGRRQLREDGYELMRRDATQTADFRAAQLDVATQHVEAIRNTNATLRKLGSLIQLIMRQFGEDNDDNNDNNSN